MRRPIPSIRRVAICLALCVLPLWGQGPTPPTIAPASVANGIVGAPYSQTLTASGGYGAGTYTFSTSTDYGSLPDGITLSAGGILSGTPTADGTFDFTVFVDSIIVGCDGYCDIQGSMPYEVVVYPSLAITAQIQTTGTVGIPYSQTFTATGGGGAGTYAWSVIISAPPDGLTLSPSGTLSGTPTSPGSYVFTVQVSSQVPTIGTVKTNAQFIFTIAPAPVAITGSLAGGWVGVAYSATLGVAGGTTPYTWSVSSGSIPAGLTFSAGVLSGTPTAAGTFAFTVQVSSQLANGGPVSVTQAFSVVIAPDPITITGSLGRGVVGVPYSATLAATGGTAPYAWSASTGSLPPGLTFSAAGTLSGTPTVSGTYPFTVQVSGQVPNIGLATATATFSVVIAPALAITGSLGGGVAGSPYSATLVAIGGTPPYAWSVSSGTLPAGLSFGTASGTLSGTPSAAGTFNFSVRLTDAASLTVTQAFTVVVYPSLAITTTTPSSGIVGVPYNQAFTASGGGGSSTYTWTLAGTPPPGLTFSTAGALSGTPTAAGTFAITVQVSSQVPAFGVVTASQTFSIVIAPLAITGSLPGGTVGVPYSATLAVTGGTPPYAWSVSSGALPGGLSFGASSGTLSGTPSTPGSFSFGVTVTDAPGRQATASFTIAVGVPPAPSLTLSGLPSTLTPATQPVLGLTIGGAYPLAIQGTITLTFAPASGPDDPNIQFTTGGRTVTFQVPAGATQAQFPGNVGLQTGTVAGTITLTLTLTAAGINITPSPAPTEVLRVNASPPAITSVTIAATSGGFNLVIVGYSTPRDMASAAVTFTPASGFTLNGNTVTVSLSQVFTTWYASSTSAQYGSMFSLTIPFTTQGGANALASVSVVLTNSQGNSSPGAATF